MEYGKDSRGSGVLRGEPVSVMSGEEVTDVDDFSYHGLGVRVRESGGLVLEAAVEYVDHFLQGTFPANPVFTHPAFSALLNISVFKYRN